MMSKMYLQHDNGGYGLLITDGAGHFGTTGKKTTYLSDWTQEKTA